MCENGIWDTAPDENALTILTKWFIISVNGSCT